MASGRSNLRFLSSPKSAVVKGPQCVVLWLSLGEAIRPRGKVPSKLQFLNSVSAAPSGCYPHTLVAQQVSELNTLEGRSLGLVAGKAQCRVCVLGASHLGHICGFLESWGFPKTMGF